MQYLYCTYFKQFYLGMIQIKIKIKYSTCMEELTAAVSTYKYLLFKSDM